MGRRLRDPAPPDADCTVRDPADPTTAPARRLRDPAPPDADCTVRDPADPTTAPARSASPRPPSLRGLGGVAQWVSSPRGGGMSPRDALRRWSPKAVPRSPARPTANKITPGVGGASPPGSAASRQAGTPALDVESLRALLREDAQLIADRLAQRMEQTQRELLADHADQILGGAGGVVNRECPSPVTPRSEPETSALGEESPNALSSAPDKTAQSDAILEASSKRNVGQYAMMRSFSDHQDERQMYRLTRAATDAVRRTYAIQEPVGNRCIDKFVRSQLFVHLCGLVILVNTITITIHTNYEVGNPGSTHALLETSELAFIAWYVLEVCLKAAAHGRYLVVGREAYWNIFDIIIVVFSVLQTTALLGALQFSYLRSLRLFKISKILRLFRFLEFVKDVKVMVVCMVHSLVAVAWVGALMIFLLYLFAIIILQAVISYLESSETGEQHDMLQARFSSVQKTMLVLFQSTTSGLDWIDPYEELSVTTWWAQATYLFFIAFFVIAVWNIVTSVFIEKAKSLSAPDREDLLLSQRRADMKDVKHLRKMLSAADVDKSGTLGCQEFTRVLGDSHFQRFMESRGIHIKEAGTFFAMVADVVGKDAEVDIDAMVSCCLCIKGCATSIDLHTLRFEMKNIASENRRCLHEIRAIAASAAAPPSKRTRRSDGSLPTAVSAPV